MKKSVYSLVAFTAIAYLSAAEPVRQDIIPLYKSTCSEITPEILNRMQYSWRDDTNEELKNPVPLEDLRYITVRHWNFEGEICTGEVVMHKALANDIREIFEELFEHKFPVHQMRLVDEYKGDDGDSILANNTYALCVRYVATKSRWSNHAYGTAIDINPRQNPYVEATGNRYHIEPIESIKYLDRDTYRPGMITKDSIIYRAFVSRGWEWGGECFEYCADLHHFQKIIPELNKTQN